MKNLLCVALLLAVVGCAASRPKENLGCTRHAASQRGLSDAANGKHREFGRFCTPEQREFLQSSYEESYEGALAKRTIAEAQSSPASPASPASTVSTASGRLTDGYGLTAGSGKEWVCEVEGAQKIFTGIGESREEASVAAVNTCKSHLQANYCRKTECKENL
ncbi:MAG: hypothetical protein ACXWQO_13060 [Bdellovibrionota bacterium]